NFCNSLVLKKTLTVENAFVTVYVVAIHELPLRCMITALLLEFFKKLNCYKFLNITCCVNILWIK
ncbi:MAG: hypothetical protein Q7J76_03775, partial [Candidatus Brocadiaceae bacterium]|nr:hypothetical protein [Candidatus Brocadiaceae bacterium]